MEVVLSKEISPWGPGGGATPFSMAVDPEHLIAIFTARGGPGPFMNYRYQMPDGNVGCLAGMVYAIDLRTGNVIWQWVHPWMRLNDECVAYCLGDGVTDC